LNDCHCSCLKIFSIPSRGQQRGISGNSNVGCDAIIVSGKREDHLDTEYDHFFLLQYCASTREGARSIIRSKAIDNTVRVFRSSAYGHRLRAVPSTPSRQEYRYDGLYKVHSIQYLDTENQKTMQVQNAAKHLQLQIIPTGRIYTFLFRRMLDSTTNQQGTNRISNNEILLHCVRMQTIDPTILQDLTLKLES
jgi:hypothetical protein